MMKNRQEGRYKGFDPRSLPTDAYERIYLSHDPKVDSLGRTEFDLRAPHNSHMATTAYLERTYDFIVEKYNNELQHWLPDDTAAAGQKNLEFASPGFSLQNNIKNLTMDFGYTTVTEHPHEWVPFYTHLYPESLKNYVKNSGRAFHQERLGRFEEVDASAPSLLDEMLVRRLNAAVELKAIPNEHRALLDYYVPIEDEIDSLFNIDYRNETLLYLPNFGALLTAPFDIEFDTADDEPDDGYFTTWRTNGTEDNEEKYASADILGYMTLKTHLDELAKNTLVHHLAEIARYEAGHTTRDTILAIDEAARTPAEVATLEQAKKDIEETGGTFDLLANIADILQELFRKHNNQLYTYRGSGGASKPQDQIVDGYLLLPRMTKLYLEHVLAHPASHTLGGPAGHYQVITYDYDNEQVGSMDGPSLAQRTIMLSDVNKLLYIFDKFDSDKHTADQKLILSYYQNKAEDDNARNIIIEELDKAIGDFSATKLKRYFNAAFSGGHYLRSLFEFFVTGFGYDVPEGDRTEKQKTISYVVLGSREKAQFWTMYFELYIAPAIRKRTIIEAHGKHVDEDEAKAIEVPADGVFLLKQTNSHLKINFTEPLVVGVHKPGVHCNIGCWRDTGDIIPRVDRFRYDVDWLDNMGPRLLQVLGDTEEDSRLRIRAVKVVKSKLHTIHYRGLLKPHAELYLHDMKTHILHTFTFNDAEEHTFEFNLQYRSTPEPLYIAFFTRLRLLDPEVKQTRFHRTYHQGPGITKLLLHNNTRLNVLDYNSGDNMARLNMLVQELYPEYSTSTEGFGSACMIPFSALPKSVYHEHFTDDIHGSISVKNTIANFGPIQRTCDICALLIYKDKYLALEENNARRVHDL